MKTVFTLITLAALAACGADGPPLRPGANAGVLVTTSGVNTTTSVGVNADGVIVNVSF